MEQILKMGATAGVIGFVSLGVFGLCCIAALSVVGLVGWVAQKIGGHDEKADTTHTN